MAIEQKAQENQRATALGPAKPPVNPALQVPGLNQYDR
jgi:hypothetical protein